MEMACEVVSLLMCETRKSRTEAWFQSHTSFAAAKQDSWPILCWGEKAVLGAGCLSHIRDIWSEINKTNFIPVGFGQGPE